MIVPTSQAIAVTVNAPQQGDVSTETLTSLSVEFPEELPPASAISTPKRGKVQFRLPSSGSSRSNPTSSIGGGSRGGIGFSLPDDRSNPTSSIGGGSRGDIRFNLPGDRSNPTSSVGGGSRGGIQFQLPDDRGNPVAIIGGGSRASIGFRLPGSGNNPISTISGGSRDGNIETIEIPKLQALLPPTNNGRTVATSPTIYIYLPPLGAEEIFFSLQDEAGNFYYDTVLNASPTGGIMAVTIPETEATLELDKPYLWYFAPIEPNGHLVPNNYSITGWIKRVQSERAIDPEMPPLQQAIAYAEEGIWYDTLTTLVNAKLSEPENAEYQTEWQDLLAQIDLEVLSTQPIISSP
ncbi:protein of unknown function DUF928 [[Leptolyngbya] sp. PCC 7376]|nr:protein of unknown function DUF928 [[Leptolyngbya] sp. PCC 7376]